MGTMIAGVYHTDDDLTRTRADGEWQRARSVLRNWVTADGAPGPTGNGGFTAERDRYHLYAAWNCPWAHRALLARVVKRLEEVISVSYAAPRRTDQGWVFDPDSGYPDTLLGVAALHEVYARGAERYTGRVTVPVLWDRATGRIVSNESADIVRMLNTAFDGLSDGPAPDLYPEAFRGEIDRWNDLIYPTLNNGVYRAGFASTQSAYDTAVGEVFATLDEIETRLAENAFLCGDALTEADLRLFPTLARFDVAYHGAFKCNRRRIVDHPNLWAYARKLYAMPGISETVDFAIYRRGYFSPSAKRNPHGIVPAGPMIDWSLES